MKRIILLTIMISYLIISVYSQENDTVRKPWHPSQGAILDGRTLLKADLAGLAMRNYSFSLERIIGKHFSLVAGLGNMPNGKLPYASLIADLAKDEEGFAEMVMIENRTISLEMRFYAGKGYGRGFYISPYYRYGKSGFGGIQTDYTNDEEETYDISLDGNLTTHSGGLMFGCQWLAGKRRNIVIDWTIFGVHAGMLDGNFYGKTSPPLTAGEQQDVKDGIDQIFEENFNKFPLSLYKHTSNVTANTVDVNLKGPWAFLRGGLSVGIRF